MSREQANTFKKHRDASDAQGNLAWAARVQQKALRQGPEASARIDVERDFELRDDERILWRLMKLPRRYMELEHCGVLDTEKMRGFLRGLVAADVLDIVEVAEAKALLPAEVKRLKAEMAGKPIEAPRQPLKARVYRPELEPSANGSSSASSSNASPSSVSSSSSASPSSASSSSASSWSASSNTVSTVSAGSSPGFSAPPSTNGASGPGASSPRIQAPARTATPMPTRPTSSTGAAVMTADERTYKNDIERAFAAAANQNHYEFLGIARPTDDSTVRAAYVRLAREYHPDRVASGPLSEDASVREKVDALFRRLGEAQAALAHAEARGTYDRTLDALGEKSGPHKVAPGGKQRRPLEAKNAFTMAETFFKRKEMKQAEAHYRQAANFDGEDPKILTALAWCIFMNPDHAEQQRTAEAKKRLTEVVNNHRYGDAAYRIGLLLRKAGDEGAAQRQFAAAHRMDPDHVEAAREVRLVGMRKEKAEAERKEANGFLGKLGLKK